MLASGIIVGQHPNIGRQQITQESSEGLIENPAIFISRAIESQILSDLHRIPNTITHHSKTIYFLASIIDRVMHILGEDIAIKPTLTIVDTGNSVMSQLKEYLYPIIHSLGTTYSVVNGLSAPIHLYLQSEPLLTLDYPRNKISSESDIHLIRSALQSVVDILITKYIAGMNILDVHEMAMSDPLLGIPGRRALNQVIQDYQKLHNVRNKFPISVLIIDLDHFKAINDTYGHNIGDQILRHVSDLIRLKCRSYGIESQDQANLYRMGGEELACIITNCSSDQALEFAQEINAELRNTPFFIGETAKIYQTASIGIATATSSTDFKDEILEDGSNAGIKIIRYADIALFEAKVTRDSTHLFRAELLNNFSQKTGERRAGSRSR